MCTYRSIFSIVKYKLRQVEIKEEIRAASPEEKAAALTELDGYLDDLAGEYCLNLKGDLEELLSNVDKLIAIDMRADSWRYEVIASCKESFGTKPFYPEVSELNSVTIFYSVDELCDTYADTFASVIEKY